MEPSASRPPSRGMSARDAVEQVPTMLWNERPPSVEYAPRDDTAVQDAGGADAMGQGGDVGVSS